MGEAQRRPQSRSFAILVGALSVFLLFVGLFIAREWRSKGLALVLGTMGVVLAMAMFVTAGRNRHANDNDSAADRPGSPR